MKPDAILKRLMHKDEGEIIGPFDLDILHLSTDPTFQPRAKTDKANVARLKSAYKSGGEVPPITVAVLANRNNPFVIVDGHHRLEAKATIAAEQERTGITAPVFVSARFIKLGAEQARWRAAEANMHHGKQMTNADIKRAFVRFVEADQHLDDSGGYLSLRDMGKVFKKDHKTIAVWLRAMFPKLALEMLDGETKTTAGGSGKPLPVRVAHQEVDSVLAGVRALFDELPSWARHDLIEKLQLLGGDLERRVAATTDFDHDQQQVSDF